MIHHTSLAGVSIGCPSTIAAGMPIMIERHLKVKHMYLERPSFDRRKMGVLVRGKDCEIDISHWCRNPCHCRFPIQSDRIIEAIATKRFRCSTWLIAFHSRQGNRALKLATPWCTWGSLEPQDRKTLGRWLSFRARTALSCIEEFVGKREMISSLESICRDTKRISKCLQSLLDCRCTSCTLAA